MNKRYIGLTLLILFNYFVFLDEASSWDDKTTHKHLSKYAADISRLDRNQGDYLTNIGFATALNTRIKWEVEKSVKDWLANGAEVEDASSFGFPFWPGSTTRSLNHFHNPLKPWDQAGLDDYFLAHYTGESSVLWAQNGERQQTIVGGDWSWQKIREYFYAALTATNEASRQEHFAKMFKGLGHQMHLLQDAAVPDHVRNDAHPEDTIMKKNIWGSRYFEMWAKSERTYVNSLAAQPIFSSVSFEPIPDDLAPVARLFDTDSYDGTNPSVALSLGLAEYTNANFFSGDTIFAAERYPSGHQHYFPYPKKSSTDLHAYMAGAKARETVISEDGKQDTGIWISKVTDGEQIAHFVRASYLTDKVFSVFGEGSKYYRTFYRDEQCHRDYAKKLIPRAVGYSAALLNYFFRGVIHISLPETGTYALCADPSRGFSKISLLARNLSPAGEEMPDGSIELVAKFRTALEDPFQPSPVATTEDFTYRVIPESQNIRSIPRETSIELTFDNGQQAIIPLDATDVYLYVIYKGSLGNEHGAVALGFKDISEPTPIDFFNNMDKICLNGTWYTAGSPEAIAAVDTNQNGMPDEWDVYPHAIQNIFIKISSSANQVDALPTQFTFFSPLVSPGDLFRTYVLSDYGENVFSFSNYAPVIKIDPRDSFPHPSGATSLSYRGSAIKNQVDYHIQSEEKCATVGADIPCDIRHYPLMYPFRGRYLWGPAGVVAENAKFPSNTLCSWNQLGE